MSNLIEIKNLNYKIDKTIIFHDFSLSIKEGSYISIVGNNGSGKTTLIRLISGLLPSKNSISIHYSYVDYGRIHDHSQEFGIVFGNQLHSFLRKTVYQEMAFSLENLNLEVKEIEKRILAIAKLFGISKLLDKKTIDLTNSEKQQVLLAISLLHNPKILLLDHPFSMMDYSTKQKVKQILKNYQQEHNLTVILTTTSLEDTLDTDYLYILNQGDIVMEGKPLTVLKEDTLLNRLGLSLPFMVDLSLKLEFYELLDHTETNMNRMVDTLWK